MKTSALVPAMLLTLAAAACSSAPPPSTAPVSTHTESVGVPPPVTTTPVPIVHAHSVQNAGRSDPFVALFGPPQTVASNNPAPTKVAVSNFPNIPTLPGFENAPGVKDVWSGVKLTGVVQHGGRIAIVEADGKSYFVRPGDRIDDKFTVLSIGPDFITLGTQKEERHFSLGG